MVEFLYATGWRLNEALQLTWDQIDWEGQVIRIHGDKTKGHDDRVFPFGLAPDLRALLEARRAAGDGPFVFHRSCVRSCLQLKQMPFTRTQVNGISGEMPCVQRRFSRDGGI